MARYPKLVSASLIFALLIQVSGCANLPPGGRDTVRFRSAPEGALVSTSLGPSCTTPCSLSLSRFDGFTVIFSKPGFASQTIAVQSVISPSLRDGVTLVPGIRIGVTDRSFQTGASTDLRRELVPNPVDITLQPTPSQ